jgi:hypothetical protein
VHIARFFAEFTLKRRERAQDTAFTALKLTKEKNAGGVAAPHVAYRA